MSSGPKCELNDVLYRVDQLGNIEYGSATQDHSVNWYPSCAKTEVSADHFFMDKQLYVEEGYTHTYRGSDKPGFCTNIQTTVCVEDMKSKLVITDLDVRELKPLEFSILSCMVYIDEWIGKIRDYQFLFNLKSSTAESCQMTFTKNPPNNYTAEITFDSLKIKAEPPRIYSLLGNVRWNLFNSVDKWPFAEDLKVLTEMHIDSLHIPYVKIDWIKCLPRFLVKSLKIPSGPTTINDLKELKLLGLERQNVQIGKIWVYEVKGDEHICNWDKWQWLQRKKLGLSTEEDLLKDEKDFENVTLEKGTKLFVKILSRNTTTDFVTKDGSVTHGVPSSELELVVETDFVVDDVFYPGNIVMNLHDHPTLYSVIHSIDMDQKVARVNRYHICASNVNSKPMFLDSTVASIYDITPHDLFKFNIYDIVVRRQFSNSDKDICKVGVILSNWPPDKYTVKWADGQVAKCWPQELVKISHSLSDEYLYYDDNYDEELLSTESFDESTPPPEYESESPNEGEQSTNETDDSDSQNEAMEYDMMMKTLFAFQYMAKHLSPSEMNKIMLVINKLESSQTTLDEVKKQLQSHLNSLGNLQCVNGCEENLEMLKNYSKKQGHNTKSISEASKSPPLKRRKMQGQSAQTEESEVESGSFEMLESAHTTHSFYLQREKSQMPSNKYAEFITVVSKEIKILQSSLPSGIWVKGFEDRLDLFSVMIRGPAHTPYVDGLFMFDMFLPDTYPAKPPRMFYISHSVTPINPNLYLDGIVCVSLLGTWEGKPEENWRTNTSTLLQVVTSIQGLILNAEPYFNEPGYEDKRGTDAGLKSSIQYNETVFLGIITAQINIMKKPGNVFKKEIINHFRTRGPGMVERFRHWARISIEYFDEKEKDASLTFDQFVEKREYSVPKFLLLPASKGFCLSLLNVLNDFEATLQKHILDNPAETSSSNKTA